MSFLKVFATGLYEFFASKQTPNSSFYVTAFALVGVLAQILTHSGSPIAMGIGALLAAVYAASQNHKEGQLAAADATVQAARAQAEAIIKAAPSIRMPQPPMPVEQPVEYLFEQMGPTNPQPGPPPAPQPEPPK
jgi:hypothetical protein